MTSVGAVCFQVTALREGSFRAEITTGPETPVLWIANGTAWRNHGLPADGGPHFARCAICHEWCWVPGDGKPPIIVCLEHSETEWDAFESGSLPERVCAAAEDAVILDLMADLPALAF